MYNNDVGKGESMGKPVKKIKGWRSLECLFTTEIYYRLVIVHIPTTVMMTF
jgi:hypothetical protein